MRNFIVPATLLVASWAAAANAAPIGPGETLIPGVAIQDITLLAGTPFNTTGVDLTIPGVSGDGSLVLNRDGQSGTTIGIPSLTGVFTGSNAALGNYRFGTLTTAGQAEFSGNLTNVIQDPSDPG
ncbi:MAG: hypothetical protein AAGA03_20635, partial [Planctomycetota bacterium]